MMANSNRSPSPDTGSTRCKAIAASTGQRCTRSGKLDGYCSAKHKEQQNGFFGMHANPAVNPFTDSEGDEPAASKTTKAKKAAGTKTTKALKALGVKKSSTLDSDEESTLAPAVSHAPTPAPVPAPPAPAKKTSSTSAAKKKATPAAKMTPVAKKGAARKKKAEVESSDEFIDDESDGTYEPTDSDADYSDYQGDEDEDEDEDEEDELEELSGQLASVKIKNDDPTLPPRPAGAKAKAKVARTKSKIFNTNKVLPPPKSKTTPTSTGKPSGFWVPAPPPAKIPESTIKILASVKEKLKLESLSNSSSSNDDSRHQLTGGKKSSGFFNYKAQVHHFLNPDKEDLDPDSKRASVRKIAHSLNAFFHKFKKSSDSDLKSSYHDQQNRPLPALPTSEEKKSTGGRRDSTESVDSVTKNVQAMSIKSNDSQDEFPNQCQGFNTNGHRCKRKVKLDRPIAKGEVLLCHDHEVDEDDEVVVHIEGKGGVLLQWLDVAAWVNPNLPDYVQNKLRKAMERPVSDTDKPGYIYAYHLLETRQTDTHTLFKVGRTDNVYRRMNEWSDKCGSPPRLIEVFPEQGSLAPKDDNDLADSASGGAGDNEVTGLRCRYSHRVERLIHIELKPFHDKDHICACKTNHREWFKVPHQPGLKDSQQMKQAWEQIRRVIVHWMSYMEKVYGPG
ncbi:hypothetical protein EMPS_00021 [Entomortierella parvispora]|uniref:Bacteriophage T5 Orf172 DNA-binding domain-containing protein n=1 Tax=Entomortierella parvispora TaxID=205924 RepID=A0A9P3LRL1_9FUNG|nr:hypothetical protein EMPS_00021 [Entomortierella parvispora]